MKPLILFQSKVWNGVDCLFKSVFVLDDPVACKSWWNVLTRKYVILSWLSGGLCILLGVLFLVIHFLVVSRTSSLQYFQTIPAYIPAIVVGLYQLT